MMSSLSWQDSLSKKLNAHLDARIAVLGIGQSLCGDDAVGPLIADCLQIPSDEQGRWLVLNGGSAPENYLGTLRHFQPQVLLLIDAAYLNQEPGEVRLLDPRHSDGCSASTHTLPLSLLAQYAEIEFGAEVLLLGIQPGHTTFGKALTPAVLTRVAEITAWLSTLVLG